MVVVKYTKEYCINLLAVKYSELGTLPKKKDFSEEEVVAIKALLGPWPRALEAVGIKPPRDTARLEKNREKRIRAKRKRTELKIKNRKEASK